mgnify:CR=1 FL=1
MAGIVFVFVQVGVLYLAYRFRPTFRPMSLEQQNLERYRQSLEPRRKVVLYNPAAVFFTMPLALIAMLAGAFVWLSYGGSSNYHFYTIHFVQQSPASSDRATHL